MLSRQERSVSSGSAPLHDVHMYVYTAPAGLLGRLVGRALRLRVREFALVVDRNSALRRVEVDTASLQPECEVQKQLQPVIADNRSSDSNDDRQVTYCERQSLTLAEARRCLYRLTHEVLHTATYPYAYFDVTHEDADGVDGELSVHGCTGQVHCSKTMRGDTLLVRCPVHLPAYNVTRSRVLFGLLRVADDVVVETQLPVSVLQP